MSQPLDIPKLDEHLAMLGRLASTLSHEIRNPLGALFLLIDVLADALQQPEADHSAQGARILAEMRTKLSCMNDLVQDYLSLARLAELRGEPVELGAIVKTYAQDMHERCADRGITLRLDGLSSLGWVILHKNAFCRVLTNLTQNAIDAMPHGGELILRGRQDVSWACLEVQDTGEGISADQLSQLFVPFHTTKSGGTGLGLCIVREILAAHGGVITVTSIPGTGTTCLVRLPLVALE
jgi:two-component system, NtrC family, sensor histidine kinase HydH